MTEFIFFDTDCLSSFLWVNQQNLLTLLYPGKIIIPKPVYDELSYPTITHLKQGMDYLINNNQASLITIAVDSGEYNLFLNLTTSRAVGQKVLGKGEAAAIVLAKKYNGIIASNNLRDISLFISNYNLKHKTTGDILMDAFAEGYITEAHGNNIWALMLLKKRRLGASSFSEYIKTKNK